MKRLLFLTAILLTATVMNAQLKRSVPEHSTPASGPETTNPLNIETVRATVLQDFEGYADFSLACPPWTTTDVDGFNTYGIDGYTFLHTGEPFAYIIFNPAATTPAIDNDPALTPHSGYRYAASFAAISHPNNDWLISPQIALGTNGHLKFWVKSYTDTYGLERYKVGVSTTDLNPSSFTIITPGPYVEASTTWTQKDFDLSAYAGMNIYVGIECVSDDAFIFMVDDVEVTSETGTGSATLTGKVTDAVNGQPIANAMVSVAGLDDITDQNGNYAINNIPSGFLNANFNASATSGDAPLTVQFTDQSTEGSQTVTASATGYTSYSNNGVVIPEDGTLELQIALSPTLASGQYRFVLTWGETPLDLDSHLKTPLIGGTAYHIFYQSQGSVDSPPYVILDIDDQVSYGPETTTIYQVQDGVYHYYIHNYSTTPAITGSNAVVQIFNDAGLLQTLQVPTTGTGLYWDVCTFTGPAGTINIINQITETEPGGSPKLAELPAKKTPVPGNRNIVSWNWTFGDGGTSTDQSPSHTYAANGTYNVALTISDGTNTNTETKNAYIQVGPAGLDVPAWEKEVSIYPNPVKDLLNINSGLMVKSVRLNDLSGIEKMRQAVFGHDFTLETGNIAPGVYILTVETEKGAMQRKISITR